jgi:sec-independent protein translocase protein TatB
MFDIGWTELMVIGVVALVVIGPKDLPDMFRTMGRFTAKARSMARDFQRAMEAAADEAGVKDVAKDLKNMTSARSMGLDAVKNAASKFEKWDPMKPAPKPAAQAPVAADPKPGGPVGPATQALADAQAAKRAALAEPVQTILRPDPEAAAPAAKAPAATADKQVAPVAAAKPKAAAKSAAAKAAAANAAAEPPRAAKPARKAKKPDSGKTEA